jgi:transcription elongation factor GreA
MLKTAVIIEHSDSEHVAIGSSVTVESDDGEETFAIVGSAEARPAQGRISNESPVGRALLGKKAGDKVVVKLPNGSDFTYTIISIS